VCIGRMWWAATDTGAAGTLTPGEALERVLSGTGLTYRYLDDKTVTNRPHSEELCCRLIGRGERAPKATGGDSSSENQSQMKARRDPSGTDFGCSGGSGKSFERKFRRAERRAGF